MGKISTVKSLPISVKRGDIYFADFSDATSVGCEQSGTRPVIIIQNDKGNKHSPTTIVAILTTKIKNRWLPTHVVIPHFGNLPRNSMACLEQIKTIDKSRLREYCGNVGNTMMNQIDEALYTSLGTRIPNIDVPPLSDSNYEEVTIMDNRIKKETIFDGKENNWFQFAEQQLAFFAEIEQYMINLEISQNSMAYEINSILDYISSTNYNVTQGYKIYRLLRERRKQQQKILEEIEQLNAITDQLNIEGMRNAYQNAIAIMQRTNLDDLKLLAIQQLLETEVG